MSDKPTPETNQFSPYIAATSSPPEFTLKAILFGILFGIIFGASTVYLALRAGLTVSASIPIAVVAVSLLKRFGGSSVLENNMIQTIGSAGESIAAGVVFTIPGFLFLSVESGGVGYFNYWTIFFLALLGGLLGTLLMVPLRKALIVDEHHALPYPEGAACASVLIAGDKGGSQAKTAFFGLGFGMVYALLQLVFKVISETPAWVSNMRSKIFPAATLDGNITAEYMGVGYILGIRSAGMLVAGGVMAWLGLIPLLASLVPADQIASQLVKLGYLESLTTAGKFGWNPTTHEFEALNRALYFAYIRQIGAGMVAAGGFFTLVKTIPTMISAIKGTLSAMRTRGGAAGVSRTETDLPLSVVVGGSLILVLIVALLPFIPGDGFASKLFLGFLILFFGFFFVTVSSRIVGLIGTSSNPVSGMTIAALMATCLIFVVVGWTGASYQPMALCVGAIVCIAAANAGATSQDLKTGYLVGATPRSQQLGLLIGVVVSAVVIGGTVHILDGARLDPATGSWIHAIGSERFPAPQGTLMATLVKGVLSANLDWQFVLVGLFLSVTVELCGVNALAVAVGAYLPLSTTLPIFCGGVIKWWVNQRNSSETGKPVEEDDLSPGNLFSTGLIAGGALAGVLIAVLTALGDRWPGVKEFLGVLSFEEASRGLFGAGLYDVVGVIAFSMMGLTLGWVALRKSE